MTTAAVVHDGALVRPQWPAVAGVHAVVTTRLLPGVSPSPHEQCNLGSRCGDAPANVQANRSSLVELLGLPAPARWLRQVHGTEVLTLDQSAVSDEEPLADAAYTCTPGVVCAVQTADCLPLLICSEDGREVAAVHAGWRGLAAGIIEAALAKFRAPIGTLQVWLGPAIASASYEVGEEVRAAFVAHHPDAEAAFTPTRPGHWLCDLYALARQRLAAAGVRQISGGDLDTFTDPRFYSHRRERPTGRFASLIWIAPPRATTPGSDGGNPALTPSPLLFPTLLGADFAQLPPRVRALHLASGVKRYYGAAAIRRGRSLMSRLCGWVTSLPPARVDAALRVTIDSSPGQEHWTRDFDNHRMQSRLWRRDAMLCERLGLVTFGFVLSTEDGQLCWRVVRVRALGLPLPARWFSGVQARESERDGRYHFDVAASLPLVGELVRYTGWLAVDITAIAERAGEVTPAGERERNRPDADVGEGDHDGSSESGDGGD